jgi:hypothetical protein
MLLPKIISEDILPFACGHKIRPVYSRAGRVTAIVGYADAKKVCDIRLRCRAGQIVEATANSTCFHLSVDGKRSFSSGVAQFTYVWLGNRIVSSQGHLLLGGDEPDSEKLGYAINRQFIYTEDGLLSRVLMDGQECSSWVYQNDTVIERSGQAEAVYRYEDDYLTDVSERQSADESSCQTRRMLYEYCDPHTLVRVLESDERGIRVKELHEIGELPSVVAVEDTIVRHYWQNVDGASTLVGRLCLYSRPDRRLNIRLRPRSGAPLNIAFADRDYEFYHLDTATHVAHHRVQLHGATYLDQKITFNDAWKPVEVENLPNAYCNGISRDGFCLILLDGTIRSGMDWGAGDTDCLQDFSQTKSAT